MLVEIIIPVVLATLVAVLIFAWYRRRRIREQKGWEGSRLPDLNSPTTVWPLGRSGGESNGASRARDTYVGDGDWNRSDVHLRGEEKETPSVNGPGNFSGPQIPESDDQEWDLTPSDAGHDFTRTFHTDSLPQDEPALAESRPGSRNL